MKEQLTILPDIQQDRPGTPALRGKGQDNTSRKQGGKKQFFHGGTSLKITAKIDFTQKSARCQTDGREWQGIDVYFPNTGNYQDIEEFLPQRRIEPRFGGE
jgi:hypothetical protein